MSEVLPKPTSEFAEYIADRSRWAPDGPWTHEPDKAMWMTKAGLPGAIHRPRQAGFLCGYVAVPRGHFVFGMTTGDYAGWNRRRSPGEQIGRATEITYARAGREFTDDDAWWWIGFACSHVGDISPMDAEPS